MAIQIMPLCLKFTLTVKQGPVDVSAWITTKRPQAL